jgi:microcompartment protein CcmK/EutM
MMLATVIGTVVCTVKFPALEGRKLLLLQPVTKDGVPKGKTMVGLDAVGAGIGETVYWCRGREAALAFDPEVVSDCSIVGIVDEITAPAGEASSNSGAGPACTAVGPTSPATANQSPPPRGKNNGKNRGRR